MIYVQEATREETVAMRAELEKHGLTSDQVTPRGRIVGAIQTDSLRVFAIVCRSDTIELEQYALETLAHITATAEAGAAGGDESCA